MDGPVRNTGLYRLSQSVCYCYQRKEPAFLTIKDQIMDKYFIYF
jgi:hypothetical protein